MPNSVTDSSSVAEAHLARLVMRRHPDSNPDGLARAWRAACSWLGSEVEGSPQGTQRYQADLRLRVSDRPSLVTFRKAAYVDLGPIEALADGWQAQVSWRASTLAPLFPVFSGMVVARADELTVSGWYAPPGGSIGAAADRALLHIAAEGTARWLLGEIDAAAQRGAG